jgi:hypothetical protein
MTNTGHSSVIFQQSADGQFETQHQSAGIPTDRHGCSHISIRFLIFYLNEVALHSGRHQKQIRITTNQQISFMEQIASLEVKLVKNLLAFKEPEGSLTCYGNPLLVPLHG